MAIAVIDLLSPESHAFDVARAWVDCQLARPLAWARLRSVEAGTVADIDRWQLVAIERPLDGELREMGEILNRLGRRSDLHIVVLADYCEPAVAAELSDRLGALVARIGRDFGPPRPATTLVVSPPTDVESLHPEAVFPSALLSACSWDDILVVSPEDTPSPDDGNELASRSRDALLVQATFGATGGWTTSAVNDRPARVGAVDSDLKARLVRGWSRIIDAGFVLDHLAAQLAVVPSRLSETPETRVGAVLHELLRLPELANDLKLEEPPDRAVIPDKEAYVLGFIKFAAKNFFKVVGQMLRDWILRPFIRAWRRFINWAAELIGAPTKRNNDDRPAPPVAAPLGAATHEEAVRDALAKLDAGAELDDPPSTAANMWRAMTDHVVRAVDDRRLSIDEAVGQDRHDAVRPLLAQLAAQYSEHIPAARVQVDYLLGALERRSDASSDEPAIGLDRLKRGRMRRVVKLLLFTLVVGAVVASLVGFFVPGLAVMSLVGVFIGASIFFNALRSVGSRLARMYRAMLEEQENDRDYQRRLLDHWMRVLTVRTYRVSQLTTWRQILHSVMSGVAAGPPLREREQHSFAPTFAPRSMQVASGVIDEVQLQRLAAKVRESDSGKMLYQAAWNAALADGGGDAFAERLRSPAAGPLFALQSFIMSGPPEAVRTVGRQLVQDELLAATPDSVLASVVPWQRRRESHGVERLAQRPGVEPPGPVGRVAPPEQTDAGKAVFGGSCVPLYTSDGESVGVAVVLSGEARLLVTAQAVTTRHAELFTPWGPLGDVRQAEHSLALANGEVPCDGVVLGGIAALRPGRPVVVASLLNGNVLPRLATISLVGSPTDGGGFVLDAEAPLGSPVIDAASGTLLGVVTSHGPTRCSGPTELRRLLMAGGGVANDADESDVDPGLLIPRDVLLGATELTDEGTAPAPSAASTYPTMPAAGFLDGIRLLNESFLALVSTNSDHLTVDAGRELYSPSDASDSSMHHWSSAEGRILIRLHRTQISRAFPLSELLKSGSGQQPNSPDRPRQGGV